MSASPLKFRALMRGVFRGDPAAAEQFCNSYQSYILRVVRLRLMRRLRTLYDSDDFVNDVWLSFFADPPRHLQFDGPDAVIRYLEEMARRKVVRAVRQRVERRKCTITREEPLTEATGGPDDTPLHAAGPSPSQVAAAEEEWQRLVRGKPKRVQRMLAMLRLGLTHREIADRLRTNEKTVQRLIRCLDPRCDA
jgi:RNA polymerase sigma factor (sigma-70 family)